MKSILKMKFDVKIKCGYYTYARKSKLDRTTKNNLTNCFQNSTYDSLRKIDIRAYDFRKLKHVYATLYSE